MLKDLCVLEDPPPEAGHVWRLFPSLTKLDCLGESTHVSGTRDVSWELLLSVPHLAQPT